LGGSLSPLTEKIAKLGACGAPALDCHGTSQRDPWIKGVAAGLDIQKESTPEG